MNEAAWADMEALALKLYEVDAVNFGDFHLRGGMYTPIYFDLRLTVSYPSLLEEIADKLFKVIQKDGIEYDLICGVPYAALPLATVMSIANNTPMVMCRKETKLYGTKKLVEGCYVAGQRCLVIDDVIVSGRSILETAQVLRGVGLQVAHTAFVVDREQGGREILADAGIQAHSLISMTKILNVLHEAQKVNDLTVQKVLKFLDENNCYKTKPMAREESSTIAQPTS